MRASVFSLAVLCAAGACATNPLPAQSKKPIVSESREIAMGRDIDRHMIATRRFYDDSAWEHYVQRLGLRLVAMCERPDLPWTFRVMDDSGINAYALPGGFVYVTRGMLTYLNSEAQLAAILGHEIGHVAARHVADQSARQEMERLGLVVGTAGGAVTTVYGDVPGIQSLLLANSRESEQEADDLGLHYMSDAGYDPTEMVAVLRMFERTVGNGGGPEWLATHPSPAHRIENIVLGQSYLQHSGARIERDVYLTHVNGLPFGLDRRKGYFQGNRFVVPDRGYQVTFPEGWTLMTDGFAVRGRSAARDAVIELTTTDEPSADSAARVFFATLGRLQGSSTRDQVNGLTLVSGSFAWLPFWVKVRGSVTFIEGRGAVDRVMGYTQNHRWSAYRWVVDTVLQTIEPLPDSEIRGAEPLRVATLSLPKPTSLSALAKARSASVDPGDLAMINQVAPDSVLPAGQIVKWVVGTKYH